MAIPTSKSELIAAIDERFAKLDKALDAVPAGMADNPGMEGHAKGTMMSANNLVAYLIGWNTLVLIWLRHDDNGQAVEFPDAGYKWNQLGDLAQKFYAEHADQGFEENRRSLKALKDRLIADISNRSDDELYGAPWHGKWTKGRMIQLNTSSPYENARARIRRWLRTQAS